MADRIERLRELYPSGTVIRLLEPILDPYAPKPAGARFRVQSVDDAGQLQGYWLDEERGSLAVIPGKDVFVVEKWV